MTSSESRLDYSHREITTLPEDVIEVYKSVSLLDVSNNSISDVSFTERFKHLNCLILDHNLVTSEAIFPFIPSLETLWLNFNEIDELVPFVDHLKQSFPNLRHLSMMGNLASPPCSEETFYEYVKYRLKVISCLKSLDYLDDRPVSQDEREEARRLYGKPTESSAPPPSTLADYVHSMFDKVLSFMDPTPVPGQTFGANVI